MLVTSLTTTATILTGTASSIRHGDALAACWRRLLRYSLCGRCTESKGGTCSDSRISGQRNRKGKSVNENHLYRVLTPDVGDVLDVTFIRAAEVVAEVNVWG